MKITFIYVVILLSATISLVILFFHIPIIERPFSIIEVNTSKCLDGTNYKFLFSKGNAADKFLIHFEGGGFCGLNTDPLIDCEKRAQGQFGSSNYVSILMRFIFSKYSRIFSQKVEYNPLFHDWNKVYIRYCDGMMHTGNTEIITNNNVKLYFHGERNVIDTIEYLIKNENYFKATEVMISGSSAGGIAATIWGNYIQSRNQEANHYIINDSGLLIEFERIDGKQVLIESLKELIIKAQYDSYYPESQLMKSYCKEDQKSIYKCFLPEYFLPELKISMLLLQSQYDNWMESNLVGIKCIINSSKMLNSCNEDEKSVLEKYSKTFNTFIDKQMTLKPNLSVWLPRSLTHTFFVFTDAWDNEIWKVGNEKKATLNEVLKEWMEVAKNNQNGIKYVDTNNDKMDWYNLKDLLWYQLFFE